MNGKGKFRRSLALVLALAMVISITGGTLAEGSGDIYVTDETRTVNGDVNGIADAYANEGETASLTVTGTVTNTDNTAVIAGTENGSVTVKTGDVTAEDPEGDQYINAVGAYTRGEKSEADVTVGDIQSDDSGASANNGGGEITMTTGDIEATQKGVELYDQAYQDQEDITAQEFAALGLKAASNIQVNDPDSNYVIRQEEYVAEDGTHYYHYVYSDGTESYSKDSPKKTGGDGATEVTTGSISVSNEGRWTQGASVNNQSEGKTSSLTVNGNITATGGSEDFSSGIEVYVTEGNGSAVVNGDVSVTGNQVSAVHAHSENGNADLTVNGNITAEAASGAALEVSVNGDGKATVQAGSIETVGAEAGEGSAVMIFSEDKDAEVAVTTGNITAAGEGVAISNRGGGIEVSTGSIQSGESGLQIENWSDSESGQATSAQVEAASGKTPDSTEVFDNPDGSQQTVEYYQISDSQNIIHDSDSNGNEEWKAVVSSPAEGSTDVTVNGDITVSDGENSGAIGIDVRDYDTKVDNKQTVSVDVTGSVNVSSEQQATGVIINMMNSVPAEVTVAKDITVAAGNYGQGAEVFASEGDTSLKVGGDIAVTANSGDGLYVYARGDGSVTAETGNVSFTSTGDSSSTAVLVNTNNDDASATVTTGNVTGGRKGLEVGNTGGEAEVTTKSVTAEQTGVNVYSRDKEIQNEISAEEFEALELTTPSRIDQWVMNGENTDVEIYDVSDSVTVQHRIYSNGSDEYVKIDSSATTGTTAVTVDGDVTVKDGDNYATRGVLASNFEEKVENDQTIQVTVTGGVEVSSENSPVSTGVYASSDCKEVTVSVGENVSVAGLDAGGVETQTAGGDVTVNVGGDVTVEGKTAEGVTTNGNDGETAVTVEGDVAVNGVSYARAISINGLSDADITVKGDVSAEGNGRTYGAIIYTYDQGEERNVDLEIGGDVTSKSDTIARGISLEGAPSNPETTMNVTVSGEVKTESKGYTEEQKDEETGEIGYSHGLDFGVSVSTSGNMNVTVGEGISVTSEVNSVEGLSIATRGEDDTVQVTVEDGGVKAESKESDAAGVNINNGGGDITVDITGDVVSSGAGLNIYNLPISEWQARPKDFVPGENDAEFEDESGWKYYFNAESGYYYDEWSIWKISENTGSTDVHIDGDINVNGSESAIYIESYENEDEEGLTATTTRVEIEGNVSGGYAGAWIADEAKNTTVNLIVDGTVEGEEQSIVLSENTDLDGLTITVWQVNENKDGNIVSRAVTEEKKEETEEAETSETAEAGESAEAGETAEAAETTVYEQEREAEKKIQYIIRIAQPDIISTEGTRDYEGYKVANEGEMVYLKLNIPSGYQVTQAWQNEGQTISLLRNENGDYYLAVPRGGGVSLSVTLEEIPAEEPEEEPVIPQPQQTPAEPEKLNDEEISTAVEELLTKNEAVENSTVEVTTNDEGEKNVVIAPAVTDEENTEDTVLTMTMPQEMVTTLQDSDVKTITMVSKSGSASVTMDTAEVANAMGEQSNTQLIVNIEENTEQLVQAASSVPAEYTVKPGAVVITAKVIDEEGNETVLNSASIVIRLTIAHEEGMKILFIDAEGNVTVTEAVWVEATDTEPGHWEVPYLGHGAYVPAIIGE